ncbi:chemotaxis protein CheW [Magnetococcales bacterium HHB-1]
MVESNPTNATKEISEQTQNQPEQSTPQKELQFVTFHLDNEIFALPLELVREIIRMPEVAAIPLSPPSMVGLANLRGVLLPIVSLSHLLFRHFADTTDATRIVVVDINSAPVGFVVDRMDRVIRIPENKCSPAKKIKTVVDSDRLAGIIKDTAGFDLIMLLDIRHLVGPEFSALIKRMEEARTQNQKRTSVKEISKKRDNKTKSKQDIQLVSFIIEKQEYAFPIDCVQEIVRIPKTVSTVPQALNYIVGVINLRGELLPLLSLRRILKLPESPHTETSRVIIMTLENNHHRFPIGVITDQMRQVLRVPKKEIEEANTLYSGKKSKKNSKEIEAVCRLKGGKRLVSILSIKELLKNSKIFQEAQRLTQEEQEFDVDSQNRPSHTTSHEVQLVVFQLAGEEYGVSIDTIQEIIRIPEDLAQVPKAPEYIEGMVNLRGQLLPVVDLRTRMDMPRIERNDRQRIIVLNLEGKHTGFIVDAVSEVMKLDSQCIEDTPNFSREQQSMMQRVANLRDKKRIIFILEVEKVMETEAPQQLT